MHFKYILKKLCHGFITLIGVLHHGKISTARRDVQQFKSQYKLSCFLLAAKKLYIICVSDVQWVHVIYYPIEIFFTTPQCDKKRYRQ